MGSVHAWAFLLRALSSRGLRARRLWTTFFLLTSALPMLSPLAQAGMLRRLRHQNIGEGQQACIIAAATMLMGISQLEATPARLNRC